MDTYAYLLISIFSIIPFSIIYYTRKDLRARMIRSGIAAIPFGLLVEYWHFQDYWQPPTIIGDALSMTSSIYSIEDALISFFMMSIVVSVFDAIFTKERIKSEKSQKLLTAFLIVNIPLVLLLFTSYFGFNSGFVASFSFLGTSIFVWIFRRDLILAAIVTGIISVLIFISFYLIIFNIICPDYWDKYWLLKDSIYGRKILGNIPLTEVLYYFSWGVLLGCLYDFGTGKKKVYKKIIIDFLKG